LGLCDFLLNIILIGVILNLLRDFYRKKKIKIIAKNTLINIVIFFYGLSLFVKLINEKDYIPIMTNLIIDGLMYAFIKEIEKCDYRIKYLF